MRDDYTTMKDVCIVFGIPLSRYAHAKHHTPNTTRQTLHAIAWEDALQAYPQHEDESNNTYYSRIDAIVDTMTERD